jgi:hypothetical protein
VPIETPECSRDLSIAAVERLLTEVGHGPGELVDAPQDRRHGAA